MLHRCKVVPFSFGISYMCRSFSSSVSQRIMGGGRGLVKDVFCSCIKWVFPKIEIPQNGWFIVENPIKMDDLGYPYFWKHPN